LSRAGRYALIIGAALMLSGVIIMLIGLAPLTQPSPSPEPGRDVAKPPECEARWASSTLVIVGPAGGVFLVEGNGSGAIVYETSIAWLEAGGVQLNTTGYEALASESVLDLIRTGPEPAVITLWVDAGDGYKILLARGGSPWCLRPVLEWLMVNASSTPSFLGYEPLPPVPEWQYSGRSLPVWEARGIRLWIDPELGVAVAYDAGGGVVPAVVWVGAAG